MRKVSFVIIGIICILIIRFSSVLARDNKILDTILVFVAILLYIIGIVVCNFLPF